MSTINIKDLLVREPATGDKRLTVAGGNLVLTTDPNPTQSDWDTTTLSDPSFIKNKPTNLSDFNNDQTFIPEAPEDGNQYTRKDAGWQEIIVEQSDWIEGNDTSAAYIKNKPTKVSDFDNDSNFISEAPSDGGQYARQDEGWEEIVIEQSDWTEADNTSAAYIKNKITPSTALEVEDPTNDHTYITPKVLKEVTKVAIGKDAGRLAQGNDSVSIGSQAGKGTQGAGSVAIGGDSGSVSQGISAVALGKGAGRTSQGQAAIAIGDSAGDSLQGAGAIAIGLAAGLSSQEAQGVHIKTTDFDMEYLPSTKVLDFTNSDGDLDLTVNGEAVGGGQELPFGIEFTPSNIDGTKITISESTVDSRNINLMGLETPPVGFMGFGFNVAYTDGVETFAGKHEWVFQCAANWATIARVVYDADSQVVQIYEGDTNTQLGTDIPMLKDSEFSIDIYQNTDTTYNIRLSADSMSTVLVSTTSVFNDSTAVNLYDNTVSTVGITDLIVEFKSFARQRKGNINGTALADRMIVNHPPVAQWEKNDAPNQKQLKSYTPSDLVDIVNANIDIGGKSTKDLASDAVIWTVGVDFPTLTEALEEAAKYSGNVVDSSFISTTARVPEKAITIEIPDGYTHTGRVYLKGLNFNSNGLTIKSLGTCTIDLSAYTVVLTYGIELFNCHGIDITGTFALTTSSTAPRTLRLALCSSINTTSFRCIFPSSVTSSYLVDAIDSVGVFIGSTTSPETDYTMGAVTASNSSVRMSSVNIATPLTTDPEFRCVSLQRGSELTANFCRFYNAGIMYYASDSRLSVIFQGQGSYQHRAINLLDRSSAYIWGYFSNNGVAASSDLHMVQGSQVYHDYYSGGCNIAANTLTANGIRYVN